MTTKFAETEGRQTQTGVILSALRQAAPGWISALELHELSGSLATHSRVADLRKAGFTIQNRTRHERGKCISEYRLVAGPPGPGESPTRSRRAAGSETKNHRSNREDEQATQPELNLSLVSESTVAWPD
jgi:hypothetical protein